jgi:hypothetical protein
MGLYIMLSAETSFFIARKADGTFKVLRFQGNLFFFERKSRGKAIRPVTKESKGFMVTCTRGNDVRRGVMLVAMLVSTFI